MTPKIPQGPGKLFETLDNGGTPFVVRVDGNNVTVYKYRDGREVASFPNTVRVFIGYDPPGLIYNNTGSNKDFGNSILVHTKGNEYVDIGESVEKVQYNR